MTEPATPPQLAANNMAATEKARGSPDAPDGKAAAALVGLLNDIQQQIEGYGALDDDGLAGTWHDLHCAHRKALSELLVTLGRTPDAGKTEIVATAGLKARAALGGQGAALKPLLIRENKLLDHYEQVDAALAAPDQRDMLAAQRTALVDLANRTQDRLDG